MLGKEIVTADVVHSLIERFLEERAGKGVKNDSDYFSLLEIACLGNAERTMQGELLYYLRCKGIKAVSEHGFGKCSFDIMVFNRESEPVVAVEMKHYSPHQGEETKPLTAAFKRDRNMKERPKNVPVILLNLFTQIESINCDREAVNQTYRFIKSYVREINKEELKRKMDKHFDALGKCADDSTKGVFGEEQSFGFNKKCVTGRVNWFLTKPLSRCL